MVLLEEPQNEVFLVQEGLVFLIRVTDDNIIFSKNMISYVVRFGRMMNFSQDLSINVHFIVGKAMKYLITGNEFKNPF